MQTWKEDWREGEGCWKDTGMRFRRSTIATLLHAAMSMYVGGVQAIRDETLRGLTDRRSVLASRPKPGPSRSDSVV
ncbi:uncharacterized protein SPSK_10168 [Sporothrix schenckii 1099-18]|uniref:Uncharacterized protein n=1 Tax=Sporothrix schenckii 1099-18 TaxID=1397361 RepID=A0A0F2M383_SPOSC|nr:uncharacterized protein SPSK_10168 [Sporothrix schenckii 1099-18]KJR84137.1 hypothetical protein SPSK_10168 [Sporothrix schenckii 1099-18]